MTTRSLRCDAYLSTCSKKCRFNTDSTQTSPEEQERSKDNNVEKNKNSERCSALTVVADVPRQLHQNNTTLRNTTRPFWVG